MNVSSTARDALTRLGISATTPRLVIAEILYERQEHPTAKDILSFTRERLPVIAPATVYNTLKLFVENTSFNTYRFYRREILAEQLKQDKECRIRVDVSVAYADKVAPCGWRHGEILENTKDNLKQIPPCTELRCACDWDWIDPE